MPADYKSRSHGRGKKPMPGYIWLLAGLAIGLFVALIVYLDRQPQNDTSFGEAVQQELEKLRDSASNSAENRTSSTKSADKKASQPRFNFYTILPELEVLIPDSEIRPPEKNTATSTATASGKAVAGKQYVLQAGSFRNRSDADRLKAQLALLGLEASIQSVNVNREDWHRVRVGPYKNTGDLYRNLNLLHRHDIDAMAMELK